MVESISRASNHCHRQLISSHSTRSCGGYCLPVQPVSYSEAYHHHRKISFNCVRIKYPSKEPAVIGANILRRIRREYSSTDGLLSCVCNTSESPASSYNLKTALVEKYAHAFQNDTHLVLATLLGLAATNCIQCKTR